VDTASHLEDDPALLNIVSSVMLGAHGEMEFRMNSDEQWFPSHLRELDSAECLELLAARRVGRVAYCDDLGPVVPPVNYALDQGTILIQISPHSTLASHLRASAASFQIDEFDDYTQTGWSVLVRGNADYVDQTDLPDADDRPHTWAEGQRTLHIRVTPHDISGRRLLPA
jgi:nitroimidazol reductase NimA-like FMN-containing flavoprotein (pyridoxamine 5'-phosphate oxidase superfamily)